MTNANPLDAKTIADFGEQWSKFTANVGYYGSIDCLEDIVGPLLDVGEIAGRRVADIGSGSGRIVNVLLDARAAHVAVVEPSDAFAVLEKNTLDRADRVELIHGTGETIPPSGDLDYVFSVGVLHHVVDPAPIVRAALAALKPGGRLVVWLYGREGNEPYLRLVTPLRAVTQRLPHSLLMGAVYPLWLLCEAYATLSRILPLPMRDYFRGHMRHLTPAQRRLTIYDQLNPAYAKYYRKEEAFQLLAANGFTQVQLYHRHRYSWTVSGTK
jgi:SAM-dependent methyltransferase